MPKYVTVDFYRRAGEGVSLSGITDDVLAVVIAEAETLVDAYCTVRGFEPLTVSNEQHIWNGVSRRVFPDCWPLPVTAVTAATLIAGTDQNVLDTTTLIVQTGDEGYVQVTDLQALILPEAIVAGWGPAILQLSYTAKDTFAWSETLADSGDLTTYYSARPLWDSAVTASVTVGGTPATPASIDYDNGSVTFSAAQSRGAAVVASYTTHIRDAVTQATIATVSMLLGERVLQQMGLTNLERARGGRMYDAQRARGQDSADLPRRAQILLARLRSPSLFGA